MNFDNIGQYMALNKEELADLARDLFNKISRGLSNTENNSDFGLSFALGVVANAIAADGKLGDDEWALFMYIFQGEFEREDVVAVLKAYNSRDVIYAIKELSKQYEGLNEDVFNLVYAISAIDGNISGEENRLLKYLMEEDK